MKPINRKIIKAGNIVEFYEYEKSYFSGKKELYQDEKGVFELVGVNDKRYLKYDEDSGTWKRDAYGRATEAKTEEEKQRNRAISLYRARNKIRRLVNANVGEWNEIPKFWTFSFKEDIRDVAEANKLFKQFIQRLRYHVKKLGKSDFEYITTIEKQDGKTEYIKDGKVCKGINRGAIHYHCIFFNLPYIKHEIMLKKWKYGGAWVEAIFTKKDFEIIKNGHSTSEKINNVGAYISKCMQYLVKEMKEGKNIQEDFLKGKKNYLTSKNLKQPIEEQWCSENKSEDKKKMGQIKKMSDKIVYQNEYVSEHLGMITHKEYNLTSTTNNNTMELKSVQERKLCKCVDKFIAPIKNHVTVTKLNDFELSKYAYEIRDMSNDGVIVFWNFNKSDISMISLKAFECGML